MAVNGGLDQGRAAFVIRQLGFDTPFKQQLDNALPAAPGGIDGGVSPGITGLIGIGTPRQQR